MQIYGSVCKLTLIGLATVLLMFDAPLPGQAVEICNARDMQGAWVTQPQGFFTAGPVAGPFAATGTLVFDGVGQFTGTATSSFNGQIIFPFGADGTYTVTPDCRLKTFEQTLRISFEGGLVNNKTEVLLYEPDPTSITLVQLRRQNIAVCDPAGIKDTWTLSATGSDIISGGRFAMIARLAFDGSGKVTGIGSRSDNGDITRDARYSGTYTLNPTDCSLKLKLTDDTGLNSGYYGAFFDNLRQLNFISNEPGRVVTGYGKRP